MRWNTTAIAVLMAGIAQQASAQTVARYDFDVAAGTRAQAIQSIAQAAGSTVSFADPRDKTLGEPVGPIKGNMTLAGALDQALAGSGWFVAAAGHGQVRIARSGANASEIIVTGRRESPIREDSSLLTRVDTPLHDTPGTVVSVTQDVLASQNTTSLDEAVRNLAGISFIPGSPEQIGSRGNTTQGVSFTNGLRNSSLGSNAPTIDVDAIEVLKGPSSILTGTQVAGGLVNFVPKLATGTSAPQIDLGVGTDGYSRADFDIGGAISDSNRLYWRAVGLAEYAERQSEGGKSPHSYVGAFMLGYRDHGWLIDTETQFYDTRTVYGRLYVNDDATRSVIPDSVISNDDAYFRSKSFAQSYRIEKDLVTSPNFTLRLRTKGLYQHATDNLQTVSNAGNLNFPPFGNITLIEDTSEHEISDQFSSSTDLYAKIITGPIQQQLIAAFDFSREHIDLLEAGGLSLYPLGPVPPLTPVPTINTPGVFHEPIKRQEYGAVVQDQLTWGRFHALASLRKAWYRDETSPVPAVNQRVSALLPSGGLVYDVTKWASVYYAYQKGLTPPQPLLLIYPGIPFPASITTGNEVGAKFQFFNNRLAITSDYFRTSSNNLSLTDPLHPGYSIPGPGQKAEGFEIAETGTITPSLFVESGFTYVKSANSTPLIGSPRYTANFWVQKKIDLHGAGKLDLGLGGNVQSKTTLFKIDFGTGQELYPRLYRDYVRFDAAIGYETGPIKLNLSVNNIFNRFNVYTPLDANNLYRGIGREVRLVLTFTPQRSK